MNRTGSSIALLYRRVLDREDVQKKADQRVLDREDVQEKADQMLSSFCTEVNKRITDRPSEVFETRRLNAALEENKEAVFKSFRGLITQEIYAQWPSETKKIFMELVDYSQIRLEYRRGLIRVFGENSTATVGDIHGRLRNLGYGLLATCCRIDTELPFVCYSLKTRTSYNNLQEALKDKKNDIISCVIIPNFKIDKDIREIIRYRSLGDLLDGWIHSDECYAVIDYLLGQQDGEQPDNRWIKVLVGNHELYHYALQYFLSSLGSFSNVREYSVKEDNVRTSCVKSADPAQKYCDATREISLTKRLIAYSVIRNIANGSITMMEYDPKTQCLFGHATIVPCQIRRVFVTFARYINNALDKTVLEKIDSNPVLSKCFEEARKRLSSDMLPTPNDLELNLGPKPTSEERLLKEIECPNFRKYLQENIATWPNTFNIISQCIAKGILDAGVDLGKPIESQMQDEGVSLLRPILTAWCECTDGRSQDIDLHLPVCCGHMQVEEIFNTPNELCDPSVKSIDWIKSHENIPLVRNLGEKPGLPLTFVTFGTETVDDALQDLVKKYRGIRLAEYGNTHFTAVSITSEDLQIRNSRDPLPSLEDLFRDVSSPYLFKYADMEYQVVYDLEHIAEIHAMITKFITPVAAIPVRVEDAVAPIPIIVEDATQIELKRQAQALESMIEQIKTNDQEISKIISDSCVKDLAKVFKMSKYHMNLENDKVQMCYLKTKELLEIIKSRRLTERQVQLSVDNLTEMTIAVTTCLNYYESYILSTRGHLDKSLYLLYKDLLFARGSHSLIRQIKSDIEENDDPRLKCIEGGNLGWLTRLITATSQLDQQVCEEIRKKEERLGQIESQTEPQITDIEKRLNDFPQQQSDLIALKETLNSLLIALKETLNSLRQELISYRLSELLEDEKAQTVAREVIEKLGITPKLPNFAWIDAMLDRIKGALTTISQKENEIRTAVSVIQPEEESSVKPKATSSVKPEALLCSNDFFEDDVDEPPKPSGPEQKPTPSPRSLVAQAQPLEVDQRALISAQFVNFPMTPDEFEIHYGGVVFFTLCCIDKEHCIGKEYFICYIPGVVAQHTFLPFKTYVEQNGETKYITMQQFVSFDFEITNKLFGPDNITQFASCRMYVNCPSTSSLTKYNIACIRLDVEMLPKFQNMTDQLPVAVITTDSFKPRENPRYKTLTNKRFRNFTASLKASEVLSIDAPIASEDSLLQGVCLLEPSAASREDVAKSAQPPGAVRPDGKSKPAGTRKSSAKPPELPKAGEAPVEKPKLPKAKAEDPVVTEEAPVEVQRENPGEPESPAAEASVKIQTVVALGEEDIQSGKSAQNKRMAFAVFCALVCFGCVFALLFGSGLFALISSIVGIALGVSAFITCCVGYVKEPEELLGKKPSTIRPEDLNQEAKSELEAKLNPDETLG